MPMKPFALSEGAPHSSLIQDGWPLTATAASKSNIPAYTYPKAASHGRG